MSMTRECVYKNTVPPSILQQQGVDSAIYERRDCEALFEILRSVIRHFKGF